jgi:hypothetical protein
MDYNIPPGAPFHGMPQNAGLLLPPPCFTLD